MPLPLPDLDDRRFDDLSAELQTRLLRQLPDLTQIAPGDPVHAFVDMFAWLAETIIYRANRIPERQRRAFLNLLQIPLRAAKPARGLVCIDSTTDKVQLVKHETALNAGKIRFSTIGEVQAAPLALRVLVKREMDNAALLDEGISLEQLRAQYNVEPAAFRPLTLQPGRDVISTANSVDGCLYLAVALDKAVPASKRDNVLRQLSGIVLNIGLAPQTEIDGDIASVLTPRKLKWEIAWWPKPDKPDEVTYLPLDVDDSSQGARRTGVARLRLPHESMFTLPQNLDPQFAGYEDTPPEAPADIAPGQLLFWLRVRSNDDALTLGYIGINAVEVQGAGITRDVIVGRGTGEADLTVTLPDVDIDETDIALDVEENREYKPWTLASYFAGYGPDDRVYTLDPATGTIRFGNGVHGKRPAADARIRVRYYRFGGGSSGNLPPQIINAFRDGANGLKLRHEWPTRGGIDRETIEAAEQRIPAFLNHRDRAVTFNDFSQLALDNPLRPTARADAVPGFFPGSNLNAVRRNVPGVISVFVLPPLDPAVGVVPKPSAGMIRDVYEYLSARTLIGTELYVLSPQYQPVSIALSIEVTDPATQQQTFRAVEQALLKYLWPLPPYGPRGAGWPRGRRIEINELRTQAARVDGVEAVNGVRLFYQDLIHPNSSNRQWRELTSNQALTLLDYQLPHLMAVAIRPGEGTPTPPPGFAPGVTTPPGRRAIPVPVIPDVC